MTGGLVDEVAKKAAVAWVSVAGGPAYAVWCLTVDGVLYVVTGAGEQAVPGLDEADAAVVTLRGDHGGAVVTYPATATRLVPGSETWAAVVPQLAGKRLNAPGTAEQVARRWETECAVVGLAPAGPSRDLGDASGAAQVRPTPAANATRKPFRLHRVPRKGPISST